MSTLLPTEFAALEPFAVQWDGETAAARASLRDMADAVMATAFHAAVQPLVNPALAFLDATPLAEHDDQQRRLLRLLLAFAHVAMAVEVQQEDEPDHARLRKHMRITSAPADCL
ncbi:MAG: hypothetical protein ABW184_12080 [Sphingobium sp.]